MAKQIIYKGKTQYYQDFEVVKNDGLIFMSGVGAETDMDKYDYKIYNKLIELHRPPQKALFLGGGALIVPKYFHSRYPSCSIMVVEADRKILQLARGGMRSKNIHFFHQMGRKYIDEHTKNLRSLDLIFLDITMGAMHSPDPKNGRILFPSMLEAQELYLYTQESFQKLHSFLNKDGVFVVNHIGSLTGKTSWVWRSSYHILRKLFRYVRVFPQLPSLPKGRQNIVLVCSDQVSSLRNKKTLSHSILSSSLDTKNKKNLLRAFIEKWHSVKSVNRPNQILKDEFILSKRWSITYK